MAEKLFVQADRDGSKALDYKETKKLLKSLHIEINKKYLKKLFEKYDRDKSNCIELREFLSIIRDITRKPEVLDIFKAICNETISNENEETPIMTIEELELFYKEVQKENFNLKDLKKKLVSFKNDHILQENIEKNRKLSFRTFVTLLFSLTENSIVDSSKTTIYQV
jgi:hypothetical protein